MVESLEGRHPGNRPVPHAQIISPIQINQMEQAWLESKDEAAAHALADLLKPFDKGSAQSGAPCQAFPRPELDKTSVADSFTPLHGGWKGFASGLVCPSWCNACNVMNFGAVTPQTRME